MENNNVPKILACAGATIALAATIWWLTSTPKPEIDREGLIEFLKNLSEQWFVATRDFAELARTVKEKMHQSAVQAGNPPISEEEFKEQLLHHCGVAKRLEEIQQAALNEAGREEHEINDAQETFKEDPEVKAYFQGLNDMLEDCLKGLSPILPNLEIPEELTETKVLEMMAKIQRCEIQRVCQHFEMNNGFLPSVQALGNVLAESNKEAEMEVQKNYSVSSNAFHSTVATYLRKSPDFASKKQKLDLLHRDRMVRMFRPAMKKDQEGQGGQMAVAKTEELSSADKKTNEAKSPTAVDAGPVGTTPTRAKAEEINVLKA